jgi:hypothetical protein
MKRILSPKIGTIVRHTGWNQGENYPCDVYIVEGQYEINGRISNYWYWRRVIDDCFLSKDIESGYGCFTESENQYKIEIKITKL